MTTVRLDLHWTAPRSGDPPFSPIANITLKRHSTLHDGSIALTPDCMTEREVDECIESLIADLNAIRSEARRRFNSRR